MERFPSAEDDDIQENAGVSGGTYEDQPPVYSSNPRGTKSTSSRNLKGLSISKASCLKH